MKPHCPHHLQFTLAITCRSTRSGYCSTECSVSSSPSINRLCPKLLEKGSKCDAGKVSREYWGGEAVNYLTIWDKLQLNNKWLHHSFMKEAELSSHQLADEQYGSWCFKDAITQCLNKRLWYDYVCFWKEPAALCLNDAKSCYDCIDLLVAVLCMCHLWVSKPLVVVWWMHCTACIIILGQLMVTWCNMQAGKHECNQQWASVRVMVLAQLFGLQWVPLYLPSWRKWFLDSG